MEENTQKVIDVSKSRFSDAPWFNNPQEIVIGGAGGIGSWVALFLARIGHSLLLYDNDVIEEVNLAGQFYNKSQINLNKAVATKENILKFAPTFIQTFQEYTEETGLISDIMFSCFDSIKARKIMFNAWKTNPDRIAFIDGRMLAEDGQVFCVTPETETEYEEKHLFEDSEVQDAPCSFKATSHCGALIASLMVNNLNSILTNLAYEEEIRPINFQTSFCLSLMNFE